jgi:Protein of unknown function with PCYCGC motif
LIDLLLRNQEQAMKRILSTVALALITVAGYAQFSNPADEIPAYHPAAPVKNADLPPILSGAQLTGPYFRYPWQVAVYKEAAQVPNVLYQLPCYCRCDKALGHTSLHSCFAGTHGAICSTCAKEGAYAYKMTKLGKTPKEIRAGIEHKDYESIDLDALGAASSTSQKAGS